MQTDYLQDISQSVAFALKEDIGEGDITAQLIDAQRNASAEVICRDEAVICGRPWVEEVLLQVDSKLKIKWMIEEGERVSENQILFKIEGHARSLLTAERPALNYLQLLSGTATITAHYANLIQHTKTKLLDTRKTIPGLRRAQKYAVKCGGGMNHRMGLFDAFLIKENHIIACGSISLAIEKAKALYPDRKVEIEVENLEELAEAISAEPDWIMLDNFSLSDLSMAVETAHNNILFEASGGIEQESDLIAIAETGVDYISMGVLTKNNIAVDLSMRILEGAFRK
ncbi:MAG: carboxylating nicotinate-nucleotide diphosphorylase [Pseudomonadales bacterium]|nr:carboxylating nicotinate-nucleotide diphosphorylase [Pseudomonadales bacterium]